MDNRSYPPVVQPNNNAETQSILTLGIVAISLAGGAFLMSSLLLAIAGLVLAIITKSKLKKWKAANGAPVGQVSTANTLATIALVATIIMCAMDVIFTVLALIFLVFELAIGGLGLLISLVGTSIGALSSFGDLAEVGQDLAPIFKAIGEQLESVALLIL